MATYTLFSQATHGALATDNSDYTMGVQFSVNVAGATLTAIYFYSDTGAAKLPQTLGLFTTDDGALVHTEGTTGSPIGWSGAAGTGWVRAAFSSPPSLTSGTHYQACVYMNAPGGNWYSITGSYWSSGAGSGGITNGPLSAPNAGGSVNGQDCFDTALVLTFPATSFNSSNYWVDPEITAAAATGTGALLAVSP